MKRRGMQYLGGVLVMVSWFLVACSAAEEEGEDVGTDVMELKKFQDCAECPEMVRLPRGAFMMGAAPQDGQAGPSEFPRTRVMMDYDLAIGAYEVTYGEYMACVRNGGCSHEPEKPELYLIKDGAMTGEMADPSRYPVTGVSWTDARDYMRWLSRKTGRWYRLPTEAEWEYAARGGTETIYWWGDEVGQGHAFCADCLHQLATQSYVFGLSEPSFVGQLPPNPYGLYDTSGNVAEWVQDCWTPKVQGNIILQVWKGTYPKRCQAYPEENVFGPMRVRRGSSVDRPAIWIRNSSRGAANPTLRGNTDGFRVATDDFEQENIR